MRDIEKNRVNNNNYYQNDQNYPPNQGQPQAQQQQYAPPQHSYYVPKTEKLWTSWLVPMFVVANIGVFIVVMFVNNCPKNNFSGYACVAKFLGPVSFQPFRENPFLGPSSKTLLKMGGLQWEKVVHQHQIWRLFSAMWLHAGVIHLVDNMMSLVLIGIRLEQEFGFLQIGLLYLVSGVGGSILSSLFLQNSVSVGASGALFGLVGAMLAELITNWTTNENKGAALFTLLFMSAINFAIGLLPFVDNFAHIGGFVTGFLLGFILLVRPRYGWRERHQLAEHARVKTKYLPYQQVLFVIALIALIAGFIVAVTMLFQGKRGNEQCKWCHYVDCIPSSRWNCGN